MRATIDGLRLRQSAANPGDPANLKNTSQILDDARRGEVKLDSNIQ